MDGMIFSAYVDPLDDQKCEEVQRKKQKILIVIVFFAAIHNEHYTTKGMVCY